MISDTKLAPVVFTDADNTLWDTDGLFAEAQLELLASVEGRAREPSGIGRLEHIREIDQKLAESHHQGLRYPVRLLAIAAAHNQAGSTVDRSVQQAWREVGLPPGLTEARLAEIETNFIAHVRRRPPALPGVMEGLHRLDQASAIVHVVSEGDRAKVADRLQFMGATNLVDKIIEAPKSVELYRRIGRLAGGGNRPWMIGDQLTRDIQPAHEAHFRTIYVPSRFRPKWEQKVPAVSADYTVATFAQAVETILNEARS